jgi:hypothetical protein
VVPEAGASNRCLTPGLDALSQGPAAGGEKAVVFGVYEIFMYFLWRQSEL